ncbi:hypothetical protein C7974DRAFT_450483 [Boeremia exigua]|uniref:uncharacterized protein n=1 Tax=Boeremia exigua TaxID=749465 RepID=UPI001E8E39D5|nr:uncharacterized protein C7974DRAFT_450483 [Boeremia exigua]KAH6637563.1 hypothetical protein C7974DRAFT_450483 [Boeremia exigua]
MDFEVYFVPDEWYSKDEVERDRIRSLVRNSSQRPKNAIYANVVSGWHISTADRRTHVTVDYCIVKEEEFERKHVVDPRYWTGRRRAGKGKSAWKSTKKSTPPSG